MPQSPTPAPIGCKFREAADTLAAHVLTKAPIDLEDMAEISLLLAEAADLETERRAGALLADRVETVPAPLSGRLRALARLSLGNGRGLTVYGLRRLARELTYCADLARAMESANTALEDELLAEQETSAVAEPVAMDDRQLELTAGPVVVMPQLFARERSALRREPR